MRIARLLTLALLAACTGNDTQDLEADGDSDVGYTPPAPGDVVPVDVRVHVIPADQRDADGAIRALPQLFGPFLEADLDDGPIALNLERPVTARGVVTGRELTPYSGIGTLPGVEGPVAGRVRLLGDDGLTAYEVPTDPGSGEYAVDVVPGVYEVVTIPDSVRLAPAWTVLRIDDAADGPDVHLDEGEALYGRVRIGGRPYSSCEVLAVDERGHATASTWTDATGFYELRVPPGIWTVMTGGGETSRDPILAAPPAEVVADGGAQVDVDYPSTSTVTASLRIEGEDGAPASDVLVRFTAVTLDSFDSLDADLVIDATSTNGNVDLVVPAGTWAVEVIPGDDSPLGPVAIPGPIEIRADRQLDTVVLPELVPLAGMVVDSNGAGVADARITCTEVGFSGRSWPGFTNEKGRWELLVSSTALECSATPPGDRETLAIGRMVVEPLAVAEDVATDEVVFQLPDGVPVSGTVTFDGTPEPYAVVEVRTTGGVLLAAGLTDADGAFTVHLPPPQTLQR